MPLVKKGLVFFDQKLKHNHEKELIIGVDEAGRGPLAGPVVACACVIYDYSADFLNDVNDSKKLSAFKRERVFKKMISNPCVRFSFAYSTNEEIDKLNILNASLKAMRIAVERLISYLSLNSSRLLVAVDGNHLINEIKLDQISIIKGDSKSAAIACASIFAKVLRDRWMDVIHLNYPAYEFKRHKGYPTKRHIELIKKYGLSSYHRKTYAPCSNL
ncbi:MAG: ribonuclease HII [Elusimicrobiota bacterium]